MKKTFPTNSATPRDSYLRRQPPSPADHHRNPRFHSDHLHDRSHLPNFTVNLRFSHRRDLRREDIETLIDECKPNPENFSFSPNESIAASLNFNNPTDAINAVVWFWESRLSVSKYRHDFTPEFIEHGGELDVRLRSLFASHVKELMEGKEVYRWIKEWNRLTKEINQVNSLLPFQVNIDRKKVLDGEKSLVERSLKEFECDMEYILMYLEENNNSVVDFDDWEKICNFIVRERKRLEEGLPIYAYRREILQQIHQQQMEEQRLQRKSMVGFGKLVFKTFCGKGNLCGHVSRIRKACMDEQMFVDVNFDENHIQLVNDVLEYEKKRLHTECMEKCLYHRSGSLPPVALFGSGAEIKHLELEKHPLSVDVFHPNVNAIDEMELLMFIEKNTSGCICDMQTFTGMVKDSEDREKWGRITFMTPNAAKRAAELDGKEFCGSSLKIVLSQSATGGDTTFSLLRRPPIKAVGIIKCDENDVNFILRDFNNLVIDGRYVRCAPSDKYMDSIIISGLDKELPETEILDVLRSATSRRILDFFFKRGDAVVNPPCKAIKEALLKEISPLMPKKSAQISSRRVQVFPPKPKDYLMRALTHFYGRLHLEAAKALEKIDGKVLPGCLSWQKIKAHHLFHSTFIFSSPVYRVIKGQLEKVLASFNNLKGLEWILDRTPNGSHRVKITANATKTVAEGRRPLEELWRGKTIVHDDLTPAVLQLMLSKDGSSLTSSIQQATSTYLQFDRRNMKLQIFGSRDKIALAEPTLIESILSLHEEKQLAICLSRWDLSSDLMKQAVKNFGPDLKDKVPETDLKLNTRDQTILLHGNKEMKPRVEEITFEIARLSHHLIERLDTGPSCPICLCEVEDGYQLEGCGHLFCRSCMVEQCESAIKNQGSFPICCAHQGCGNHILLGDLRTFLSNDKLEELFRASLGAFVASSSGTYRFCPSPDCPSIYRVADPDTASVPFVCGACYSKTCTRCHLEYHPYVTCEKYRQFKDDPDSSLRDWCKGKEQVKKCPACGRVIEKVDGCNHIECKCGKHICWVCLEFFTSSSKCYRHMKTIHNGIH